MDQRLVVFGVILLVSNIASAQQRAQPALPEYVACASDVWETNGAIVSCLKQFGDPSRNSLHRPLRNPIYLAGSLARLGPGVFVTVPGGQNGFYTLANTQEALSYHRTPSVPLLRRIHGDSLIDRRVAIHIPGEQTLYAVIQTDQSGALETLRPITRAQYDASSLPEGEMRQGRSIAQRFREHADLQGKTSLNDRTKTYFATAFWHGMEETQRYFNEFHVEDQSRVLGCVRERLQPKGLLDRKFDRCKKIPIFDHGVPRTQLEQAERAFDILKNAAITGRSPQTTPAKPAHSKAAH
jgi:hypothetical protein